MEKGQEKELEHLFIIDDGCYMRFSSILNSKGKGKKYHPFGYCYNSGAYNLNMQHGAPYYLLIAKTSPDILKQVYIIWRMMNSYHPKKY